MGLEQEPKDLTRSIADYIAGMTDSYAIHEFRRLFMPQGCSLD